MPVTVDEKLVSRIERHAAEVLHVVQGAASAVEARAAALAATPTTFNGLPRNDVSAEEILGADGLYEARVSYASVIEPEDGTIQDSFEVALSPVSILQSRQTVSTIAASGITAPNFQRAINVDQDRRVQGIDWPVSPAQTWTRTATIAPGRVTQSYYRQLSSIAGKVNSGTFQGFNARELLFLGASGSREGLGSEDPWKISYRFGVSLRATDIDFAAGITIPTKEGWDYAWGWYTMALDGSQLVPKCVAAYVERIAAEADFSQLEPPPL